VGQRLRFRLSLWQGEFVLDRSVGIPALSVILAKGRVALAEALLRRAIATCPGVAALRSFSLELDRPTRAASVAFDAVDKGIETGADVVVIDTAGRLHTKTGLMDELGKVKRVVWASGGGCSGGGAGGWGDALNESGDVKWVGTGEQFFTYLRDAFDALYLEGETAPKMMSVGLHCRVVGKPGRIGALRRSFLVSDPRCLGGRWLRWPICRRLPMKGRSRCSIGDVPPMVGPWRADRTTDRSRHSPLRSPRTEVRSCCDGAGR
jgi:hypothetical protein